MTIFLSEPVKSVRGICITLSGPKIAGTKLTPPEIETRFEKVLFGLGSVVTATL